MASDGVASNRIGWGEIKLDVVNVWVARMGKAGIELVVMGSNGLGWDDGCGYHADITRLAESFAEAHQRLETNDQDTKLHT